MLKYVPLIILSINQFIPQKDTPFEEYPYPDRRIIKQYVKLLKKELAYVGNIKLHFYIDKQL